MLGGHPEEHFGRALGFPSPLLPILESVNADPEQGREFRLGQAKVGLHFFDAGHQFFEQFLPLVGRDHRNQPRWPGRAWYGMLAVSRLGKSSC